MKKIIVLIIFVIWITSILKAQNFIHIHHINGLVVKYNTNVVDSITFSEVPSGPTVTDVDGNTYNSVIVGTQVWMKENLKTTKYNDGTPIPLVTDDSEWLALTTPAYCWYNNDEAAHKDTYGALYNGHAALTDNLCPTGWHVSTDEEWTILINYLGGEDLANDKIRETGFSHWYASNNDATNESGITLLPGGWRAWEGFKYLHGYAWMLCPSTGGNLYDQRIDVNFIVRSSAAHVFGQSIRCIKD